MGTQRLRSDVSELQAEASASFTYIFLKVSEVFPGLVTGNFNLFWKDSDGDLVSFSSDEELMEALGFVTDSVFRIYVREHAATSFASSSGCNGMFHPNVVRDACKRAVRGIHYKCVCPDYDLCSQCEAKKIHWHNRHGGSGMETEGDVPPGADIDPNQDGEQDAGPEEEYLHNVGENVAAMMDPFGIDVNSEVEHQGRRRGGQCHGAGRHGCRGFGGGCGGPRDHGYQIRHCHRREWQ
ncbi:sequestosome-1-like [Haliotis rubra]|uniref:sequestosome-1-like n=1 Tax=Haliotis rubra TaxID=36100 RepID=UPI001EE595E3|nr:sequestosome-1-like [Haliotis rubra]